jgi:hypothetical protein
MGASALVMVGCDMGTKLFEVGLGDFKPCVGEELIIFSGVGRFSLVLFAA